ncbi:hypothetical protein Q9L58_004509 [Maublancomyces gigas]|uniref:CCR4-NOT transcription complex subunit 11 n=1 Tax=Discina gigas TaxID=1032678 RepID=A0ABR3GKV1_9PEZI
MRISRDSLSPSLVDLLSAWTVTFQTTAAAFLAQPSVISEPFSRVCELHNTLLLLEQSKQPTTVLEVLRESEDDDDDDTATLKRKSVDPQNDAVRQAQELLGFMLNAEFVLFELYREYAIRMNPSLSHWVTVSRDFDRWYKANTGPDGQPVGEWGVKEKVFKIRVAFVKGILAEQGPKLAQITPHDCASRGLDFTIDLHTFNSALREQGLYDSDSEEPSPSYSTLLETSTDESGYSSASGITSNTQSPSNGAPPAQDQLSAILVRAVSEVISSALTTNVLEHLDANRSLLNSYPLDFISVSTLTGLVSFNPILARGIMVLLLSEGTSSTRRSEVLSTLSFLPVVLATLDLLNRIITQSRLLTKDEASLLLHGFLANAIRSAEALGENGGAAAAAAAAGYEDYEATGGGVAGGVGGGGRRAQTRSVTLLCLFITSLLRDGAVEAQEVYYEVQELGVRFVWVKEARELWKSICG